MHAFTICARNYLGYALTCREAFERAMPGQRLTIFLADDPLDASEQIEDLVDIAALGLPGLWDMALRYSVLEFSTAIKAACFQYLFEREGASEVVYLDPDIFLLAPLDAVRDAFDAGAPAMVTPHISGPIPDELAPTDMDILRSGIYNLGFLALSRCEPVDRFLQWWAKRLREYCYNDAPHGLFVDQRLADFIPSFLPGTRILNHPGYNLAYWNLHERPVTLGGTGLLAAGEPVSFVHFSGVVPGNPSVFSKHQSRHSVDSIGAPLRELLESYLDALARNGQARWSGIPYGFGRFSDGVSLPDCARRALAASQPAPATSRDEAFRPQHDVLNAQSTRIDPDPSAPVSLLMHAIYDQRPDLQGQFPLATAKGRAGFLRWFLRHGAREYRLDERFLEPAHKARGINGLVSRTLARR